ncbi:MAG: succinate--CoA ligase subunit alpha, partial [Chloroflexota bacterium]
MSILIDGNTKLLIHGITGRQGMFHTRKMLDYGTRIVGGVTPGKGGQEAHGVPVFDSAAEAVKETGANCSMISVPARFAADSIFEAVDAGVDLVICLTEGIPVQDMLVVRDYLDKSDTRMIGP